MGNRLGSVTVHGARSSQRTSKALEPLWFLNQRTRRQDRPRYETREHSEEGAA
jgi:hypothetical protein